MDDVCHVSLPDNLDAFFWEPQSITLQFSSCQGKIWVGHYNELRNIWFQQGDHTEACMKSALERKPFERPRYTGDCVIL